ncbi:MAG TPA: ferredoxin, partial [Schlesneria sp.]
EKEGTFINHKGLAQAIHRGLRGPDGSRPDGRILLELLGRKELFHADSLRKEIAAEIPALQALSVGVLGEQGVMLDSPAPVADLQEVK